MSQAYGSPTCWFLSAFNGLMLGWRSSRLFHDLVYSADSRNLILTEANVDIGTCPRRIGKAYILRAMHHFFETPQPTLATNRAANDYAGRVARLLFDQNVTKQGGNAIKGLRAILAACFPRDFSFDASIEPPGNYYKPAAVSVRWPAFRPTFWITHLYHEYGAYPVPLRVGPYDLDHAVLGIEFKTTGHAVVVYTCGSKQFLFDSNEPMPMEVPWATNPKAAHQKITKAYSALYKKKISQPKVLMIGVMYVCYVRRT